MLGTIMAANVLFVIIPAHWELVRAKQAGREPDPMPGIVAKQRSVHNNYLTLPVLFTMLAGHFAFTYTHDHAWPVLVALMVVGAAIRHYFNRRHAGRDALVDPDRLRGRDRRDRRLAAAARPGAGAGGRPSCTFAAVQQVVAAALPAVPLAAPDAAGLHVAARGGRHSTPRPRSPPRRR